MTTHANDCKDYLNEISSLNDTAMTIEVCHYIIITITLFSSLSGFMLLAALLQSSLLGFYHGS